SDRALQDDGGVQVREGCCRRWIGQVISRYVHRLERSDRAVLGGSDALLQGSHFRGESWLVTHCARGAAQQGGNLGPCLRKAKNVIDEQQHILVLLIAEVLGNGETRQGHAQAGTRRFIHLPVHQSDLGFAQVVLLYDSRLRHLVVEVVAFASAFAHTGEHGNTAVELGDIVNQFHDHHGLADAGATESTDFSTFQERADEVDYFDSCGEQL